MASAVSNPSPIDPKHDLIQELRLFGFPTLVSAGEKIILQDNFGRGIYLLHRGSLRLAVYSEGNDLVSAKTLERGSVIGLSAALIEDDFCYSVEALEPSQLTFVSAARLQDVLRCRPELCLKVVELLGNELSSLALERALADARRHRDNQPLRSS